jgi:hypothetical protein
MGTRRRLIARPDVSVRVAALVMGIGLLACSSCKSKEPPPSEQSKPPDHLVTGEAVEGKERAFGLPLPRLARVEARFEKTVDVYSALSPEDLVNFVRARVKDGKVTPGSSSTILAEVVPLSDPQKRLTVEVRAFHGGDGMMRSEMLVHDTTPVPSEPGLTDEQRWQKAGLTPSGQIADPRNLK